MDGAEAVLDFETERARLAGVAYRVTGSRADAEDIVQEAWIRWERAEQHTIERPAAWLTTVTSRLALDRLKSARHQREVYVGPWLPDPVDEAPGPDERAELAESLSIGFLTVLERLGPTERVVFLLADVFALPYDEIGKVVDKSPTACRQVASRARRAVRQDRPRFAPTDANAWDVAMAFLAATTAGDIDALVDLLAEDALVVSDGGAHRRAARRPIVAARAPRYLANMTRRSLRAEDEIELRTINGQPGIIARGPDGPTMAVALATTAGRVDRVWVVMNPEKLAALDAAPLR